MRGTDRMRGTRVLLVDDEPRVVQSLARNLRAYGITALAADGPGTALQLLAEHRVDAVISDQEMPGRCGVDLLCEVHRTWPRVSRVLLTGRASLDLALDAINRGAVERFLTKPCEAADLVGTLHGLFEQRDLAERARRAEAELAEQRELLSDLEVRFPGITQVERDSSGAVLLDRVEDVEGLIERFGGRSSARTEDEATRREP